MRPSVATPKVFDDRVCTLGEGLLWHPARRTLFWFDIIKKQLLSKDSVDQLSTWQFNEHVSAAGWIDHDTLLIAGESALFQFNLKTGSQQTICPLEADNPITRSNDGRADPWGGFWIGTMGKKAEPAAGALYRFYRGELRQLRTALDIPNAICFSPDRRYGYFADTREGIIWRQALEPVNGWPVGTAELFINCKQAGVNPDGAVVDSEGYLWNAQWGSSRVARYNRDGELVLAIPYPAAQISCPAFGGENLRTLFATSATEQLSLTQLADRPDSGKTFAVPTDVIGQEEFRVLL